ncbi:cysteine hydrolase family protein [Paenibacillus crassostreae]|uniref:Isochorismatase n=1 Tax=Paenibacillus crassostreae TaxID=1763538 RepID=A0A167FKN3_9BACL|nr:isochorismatase family cysteine hydrolase [Paenibacillus crassostreae]AOZ94303.1 isochorismatase [Paenibacillus crassostreae]OAB76659.1 isochorismatase [Paenibacillus crassostreae]
MDALIVIDFTYDFVEGSLPVGQPAIDIQETIATLTQQYVDQGDFVVMAVDLHEENDPYHPESKLFPPHNIRGTQGRALYGELANVYQRNMDSIYWMDKSRYSAFCGTNLDILLKERGITKVHLIGVCTDICVLHTAVDAYNKGYAITVFEDAVASFNPQGHEWALAHFKGSLGAEVIISSK